MTSRVTGDPFAGEAQWVIEVALRCLSKQPDVMYWYHNVPIPALQLRTAAELVRSGNAGTVVAYLESFVPER